MQAYHQNMYGERYVWVISGPTMFGDSFIQDAEDNIGCTKEQLRAASAGFFRVNYYSLSKTDDVTIVGEVSGVVSNIC